MVIESFPECRFPALDFVTILAEVLSMMFQERVQPLYTIYYYTDFLYRVVKFKRSSGGGIIFSKPSDDGQGRLSQSYSRSRRMVLQYSLCNPWDYFITITVDFRKCDRYALDDIYDVLYHFFRSYSSSSDFAWLLVPENHKDGAWHFHGFISGISGSDLSYFVSGIHPQKLVDAGYLNWPALAHIIGYVSLAPLKNPTAAAFYVTKYITKEHANDDFYQHLYYHSRGLKTARPVSDCYCPNFILDSCLTFDSDFCSCGWAFLREPDFSFPFSLDGVEPRDFSELTSIDEAALAVDVTNEIFVQLSIDEWHGGVV